MKKLCVTLVSICALALSLPACAGARTVDLKVDGMSCALCAPAAKKALKKVDGVTSAEIEGDRATVVVEEKVKETDLVKAIERAGFTATVVNSR